MTIQRRKLKVIAELVRGASAEDMGSYETDAIGRAWDHEILERPNAYDRYKTGALEHTAAQLGLTKAQAEALFELPFALRPWLDGDHCSRLIYNFLAENPEEEEEESGRAIAEVADQLCEEVKRAGFEVAWPSDEEHGVLDIARAPMSGSTRDHPHEWVMNHHGTGQHCDLCGQPRDPRLPQWATEEEFSK